MKKTLLNPAFFAAVILTGFLAPSLFAQQQPRTTVQLPVFSFFRGVTTINVPDHGQALLGSVKRSATGTVSRGVPILGNLPYAGRLFKNRASGSSQSASTLSAQVEIYDLREMDRAILESARRKRELKIGGDRDDGRGDRKTAEREAIRRKADFISRNLGGSKSKTVKR